MPRPDTGYGLTYGPPRVRISTMGVPPFWPHFVRIGTGLTAKTSKICPDWVTPLEGIIRGPPGTPELESAL
jgi:hypothetical protein